MKVVASGYFDPLHVGHIEYLERARALGTELIVIINNDKQAKLKRGYSFMPEEDRAKIVGALWCVNNVVISIDDDTSVCKTLESIRPDIFANGGDRHKDEIPEAKTCEKYGIKMVDELGKKIRASSDFLEAVK